MSVPVQLPLPFKLPPMPERKERLLPAPARLARAWVTERVMCGGWVDARSEALLPVIQQMGYDDVLLCGDWRLEFLWLEAGYPHYRLYWYFDKCRYSFGIADVRMRGKTADLSRARQLAYCQRYLAAYCVALGFRAHSVKFKKAAAVTKLDADTSRQERLFTVRLKVENARAKAREMQEEQALQMRLRAFLRERELIATIE